MRIKFQLKKYFNNNFYQKYKKTISLEKYIKLTEKWKKYIQIEYSWAIFSIKKLCMLDLDNCF